MKNLKTGKHPKDKSKNKPINGKQIAETSQESFNDPATKKKHRTIKAGVLAYLQDNDKATSRQLAKIVKCERGSITRPIIDLHKKERLIYVIERAKCPTTGNRVRWYAYDDREPNSEAA